MDAKWVRCSRANPCVVCKRPDWCSVSADGTAAHCMRIAGGREVKSGGYIHRLDETIVVAPAKEGKNLADVSALAAKMFKDKLAGEKREKLAKQLGVSVASLESLHCGIGWDYDSKEFASFPARDEACKVIGITRRYGDGRKMTMAGTSNRGVFVPESWWTKEGPILIVEGASDVAALTTHGFAALGRPSNIGGVEIIASYLDRRADYRDVLVVGENDRKPNRPGTADHCPKDCEGCSWCWPGRYGAKRVATALNVPWAILPQPFKDIR